jgi:hypothetical protein
MAAMNVPGAAAWSALVGGHGALLAAMPDVGTIAAAISTIGLGLLGLYVIAVRQITQAKIDATRAWEEAQKGSLTAQLAQMQADAARSRDDAARQMADLDESLKKARESLHMLRDEYQAERMRLQGEIASLTDELHATRQELASMRVEYRKLLGRIETRGRKNEARLDAIDGGSDDDHDADAARPKAPADA